MTETPAYMNNSPFVFESSLFYIKQAKITCETRIADDKNPKSFFKYIRSSLSAPVETPQVRNTNSCVVEDESSVADNIPVINVPSNVAPLLCCLYEWTRVLNMGISVNVPRGYLLYKSVSFFVGSILSLLITHLK